MKIPQTCSSVKSFFTVGGLLESIRHMLNGVREIAAVINNVVVNGRSRRCMAERSLRLGDLLGAFKDAVTKGLAHVPPLVGDGEFLSKRAPFV